MAQPLIPRIGGMSASCSTALGDGRAADCPVAGGTQLAPNPHALAERGNIIAQPIRDQLRSPNQPGIGFEPGHFKGAAPLNARGFG